MEKKEDHNLNKIGEVYSENNLAESLSVTFKSIERDNSPDKKEVLKREINKTIGKAAFLINGNKIVENDVIKDLHFYLNQQVGIKSQNNCLLSDLKKKLTLANKGLEFVRHQKQIRLMT